MNNSIVTLTTQPGLTANGEPTSNVELTVPYSEIRVSDTYGLVEVWNTIVHRRVVVGVGRATGSASVTT